jgi:hypothetical protein
MTITWYFLLSMTWTLLSMGWFVICNHYTTQAKMPKPLNTVCGLLQRLFFCCFSQPKDDDILAILPDAVIKNGTSKKSDDEPSSQTPPTRNIKCISCRKLFSSCFSRSTKDEIVHIQEHTVLESMQNNRKNPDEDDANKTALCILTNGSTEEAKLKCNFCDRCKPCCAEYDKDKAKEKKKKEIESKCSALNYFVFICILLFMFISNMVLWLSMAN